MSDIVVSSKKTKTNNNDFTVKVNGKILNRFNSFNVSHSIDTVPMSFSLEYSLSDGESGNELNLFSKKKEKDSGLLVVGQKVEIYLGKSKILTGYIDNSSEVYDHNTHSLYVDGRSITQTIVDCETTKPAGILPTNLVSLRDVANYMFEDFGIFTLDKSNGLNKFQLSSIAQIDLTTKPFDYVSMLAQYEGKLLYDNEYGEIVISDVSNTKSGDLLLNDDNSIFENISVHKTTLGRYRKYTVVFTNYGGMAGINTSLIPNVVSYDPEPNELPPGKNHTVVNTAAYPTSDSSNGLILFAQNLAQWMANVNWGRGQTLSATATGFINPTTNDIWRINTLVSFDMKQPLIKGDYIVQSVNFSVDTYGGKLTELVFIRKEALSIEPITIAPMIAGVNQANNPETSSDDGSIKSSTDKNQKLEVSDSPPPNAKPVEKKQ